MNTPHPAQNRTIPPDERLLRLREITARLGVSRATVYQWISLGKFPPPTKLGKSSCWPWSVVRQVMQDGVDLEG